MANWIFLEAMKSRREIEDNDWEFEQLQEVIEATVALKRDKAIEISDELKAFSDYLKERCSFGINKVVIKTELKKIVLNIASKKIRKCLITKYLFKE